MTCVQRFSTLFPFIESLKGPHGIRTEVNSSTNHKLELDFFLLFTFFSNLRRDTKNTTALQKAEPSSQRCVLGLSYRPSKLCGHKIPKFDHSPFPKFLSPIRKWQTGRKNVLQASKAEPIVLSSSTRGCRASMECSVSARLAGEKQVKLRGCT